MNAAYAVPLSCGLPYEMPLQSWPCATEDSAEWYAVIEMRTEHCEDVDGKFDVETAVIIDVRRSEWELPPDVIDLRGGTTE